MQAVRGVLAGCAVLFLAVPASGDDKQAKELLVGKWEAKVKSGDKEATLLLEFDKDGKVSMKVTGGEKEFTFTGKYKVIDENTLELMTTVNQKTMTDRSKFKVTKDSLELSDKSGGKPTTFTRAK